MELVGDWLLAKNLLLLEVLKEELLEQAEVDGVNFNLGVSAVSTGPRRLKFEKYRINYVVGRQVFDYLPHFKTRCHVRPLGGVPLGELKVIELFALESSVILELRVTDFYKVNLVILGTLRLWWLNIAHKAAPNFRWHLERKGLLDSALNGALGGSHLALSQTNKHPLDSLERNEIEFEAEELDRLSLTEISNCSLDDLLLFCKLQELFNFRAWR